MSFLMNLISGKTVEKVIDMVGSGADAVHYSKEEEGAFKLAMLKAMGPQSVARRFIAIAVTGLWCFLIIAGFLLKMGGLEDRATFTFSLLRDVVAIPFSIVLGFYFLANVVRSNKK